MGTMFPRTTVAGIDMPRMIAGTNWILGYSHTSSSADQMIVKRNKNREAIVSMLRAYNEYGINAVMGPFGDNPVLADAVHQAEDELGGKIIIVDTPIVNVDDSAEARREAESRFRQSRELGAFTPEEVHEDVEIALAAIERRQPNLEGRSSPAKTEIMPK